MTTTNRTYPWSSVTTTSRTYPWSSVTTTNRTYPWSSVTTTSRTYPWSSVTTTSRTYPWSSVTQIVHLVYNNFICSEINRIRHKFYQLMKSSLGNYITNITHLHMKKSMHINGSIPVTITHVKENRKTVKKGGTDCR